MTRTFFAAMMMVATLTFCARHAHAAITDCQPGCFIALTDQDGVMFVGNDGSILDTLTGVGTGEGIVSVSDGYAIIVRQPSREVWIYDLKTGNESCYLPDLVAQANKSTVAGGYVWITHEYTNTVSRVTLSTCDATDVPLDMSGYVGIDNTADAVWLLNSQNGNVLRIDPLTSAYTVYATGLTSSNAPLWSIKYNGTGFFVAGRTGILGAAVYEINFPYLNNATLWWQGPYHLGDMEISEDYVVSEAQQENHLYIIPRSDPSLSQMRVVSAIRSVAVNENIVLAAGGADPFIGVFRYDGNNGFLMDATPVTTSDTWSVTFTGLIPVCGNGTVEGDETCDSSDFGGQDCTDFGFDYGQLTCTTCTDILTTGCYSCGDGAIGPEEQCDGTDLGGATCQSLGYDGGTLACGGSCQFDASACYRCGDGMITGIESCDGSTFPYGVDCESFGYSGGNLLCTGDCQIDESQCVYCGDGVKNNWDEECDGTDLGGETCESQGFASGTLSCTSYCWLDNSGCHLENKCGNDAVEEGEECDNDNLNSTTCVDLGYASGTLACSETCRFDRSGCAGETEPVCGNGVVEVEYGETCDSTDVNRFTCEDFYLVSGQLLCNADCSGYDLSRCIRPHDRPQDGCHCSSQNNATPPLWIAFLLGIVAFMRRKRRH